MAIKNPQGAAFCTLTGTVLIGVEGTLPMKDFASREGVNFLESGAHNC